MLYNHYKAYKEFKEMWEQLRKDYKEAGMSDEAIEKIYQYDLYVFNRDRAFIEHMYPQPLNTGVDEDILVFCGVMDITVGCLQQNPVLRVIVCNIESEKKKYMKRSA